MGRMPRYLIVRTFEVSEDAMPDVGRRSREIAEDEFPEITWEHSHVIVDESGGVRTFCVYGAPDPETVRSHGERLGRLLEQATATASTANADLQTLDGTLGNVQTITGSAARVTSLLEPVASWPLLIEN